MSCVCVCLSVARAFYFRSQVKQRIRNVKKNFFTRTNLIFQKEIESDFDEKLFEPEAGDSELDETLHGKTNDKLLQNRDETLTFEDEQSDDGDTEANEPAVKRQCYRQHKKYAVASIRTFLAKSTMT